MNVEVFPRMQFESTEAAYPMIRETIPQTELGYSSNNRFDGLPPFMTDGRSLTNSNQSLTLQNHRIIQNSGFRSNAEYRDFLIKNSDSIMQAEFRAFTNDIGYSERFADHIVRFQTQNRLTEQEKQHWQTPALFTSLLNTSPQEMAQVRNRYPMSDIAAPYLSREELHARRLAPAVITQAELFQQRAAPLPPSVKGQRQP